MQPTNNDGSFTVQELNDALPSKLKGKLSQSTLDSIASTLQSNETLERFKENFVFYSNALNGGKYSIQQYIDAVRYVTFKLMGMTNLDAYRKAFPDRFKEYAINKVPQSHIASYVSAYNKNKLVNQILEQAVIPNHILYQEYHHKALMVQVDLMNTAESEKVRSDAANSVLTHTKPPEMKQVELNVNTSDGDVIDELREVTSKLAQQAQENIKLGKLTAQDMLEMSIVSNQNYDDE